MTRNTFDVLFDDVAKAVVAGGYPAVKQKHTRQEYTQHKNEDGYRIEIPAIGAVRDNVSVHLENSILHVSVKPSVDSTYAKEFNCQWTVPEDVDVDTVNAKLENGLLTVSLRKMQPVTRKVTVAVA